METARDPELENALSSGFRGIFDAGPFGMAAVDQVDRLVVANSELCRMFEYSEEELRKLTLSDVTHPADVAKDDALVKRLMKGEIRHYRIEKRYVKKSGASFWANLTVSAIRARAGAPISRLLVIEDIAERRLSKARMGESESRFRSLAESAIDAVVVCRNAGTEVAFWNKGAEKMFGYSRDEIVGKPLAWIIPEHLRAKHTAGVERYLARGEALYLGGVAEFSGLRKDGAEFPIEISLGSWRSKDGMSFTAIIRDITARKHAERLNETMNDVNTMVNSTLDFDEIARGVMATAGAAVGADTTVFSLFEAGRWNVAHAEGRLKKLITARFAEDTAPLVALAGSLGRPIAVKDALHDNRLTRELAESYRLRSLTAAPLVVETQLAGALLFIFHETAHQFTDAEIDFTDKLAGAVSLAIENSRLHAQQRDIANTLQEALIMVPERLPGVEIAYHYRAATEAVRVGGDFYDIFALDHAKLGILVGDVSGKGARAATLTTVVKNTVKAFAFEGDAPSAVIGKTNNVLGRVFGAMDFATLVFLILDTETGELKYCNAGHPPPIIANRDRARFMPVGSLAAGVFPDVDYKDVAERLGPGDILFLYTDGVTEARRGKALFGDERLPGLAKAAGSPEAVTTAVLDKVLTFCGNELFDDLAIFAVALKK